MTCDSSDSQVVNCRYRCGRGGLGAFLVHVDERLVESTRDEKIGFPRQAREIGAFRERLRHAELFQFTPQVECQFVLEQGKEYVLKYRMVVFDGSLDNGSAEACWNDFSRTGTSDIP